MDEEQIVCTYSENLVDNQIKKGEIMYVIVTTLGTLGLVLVATAKLKEIRLKRKVKKTIKEFQ